MQVRKLLNGQALFALINNAGAAFHGPLMYQPIEEFRKNIEINLIGTLQVTQVRQDRCVAYLPDTSIARLAVIPTLIQFCSVRSAAPSDNTVHKRFLTYALWRTCRLLEKVSGRHTSPDTRIAAQAFLPLLGADSTLQGPPGRIVMVSSVGGKFAAPFIGGYVASKHGMEGMSASLRRELMIYGIDVIIVGKDSCDCPHHRCYKLKYGGASCNPDYTLDTAQVFLSILRLTSAWCHEGPGAVATPIWDKAEAQDVSMYDDTPYKQPLAAFAKLMLEDGRSGHSTEHIARCTC